MTEKHLDKISEEICNLVTHTYQSLPYGFWQAVKKAVTRALESDDDTTFYNHGTEPIFISTKIETDPLGGPGSMENKIIIQPKGGIDLKILHLKRGKP